MPKIPARTSFRRAAAGLACVFAAFAVAACTSGGEPIDGIGGDPDGEAVTLAIAPGELTVTPGGTADFTVEVRDGLGGRLTPTVAWSAEGGAVVDGRFTAGGTTGTFRVVASAADGAVADTATVTIAAASPGGGGAAVTRVSLTPIALVLVGGESERMTATASYSDGTSAPLTVSFSATGGSVSADGMYVAGTTTGDFRVVATHASSGLADTSTVRISSGVAGAVGGAGPNQPAGFTAVFDHPLAARPPADPSSDAFGFKYYGEQPHLTHQPGSGTAGGALRVSYPAAFDAVFQAGSSPARFLAGGGFPANGGNWYCRVRWRASPNWTNNGNPGGIKFFFYRFGGNDQNHYVGFDRLGDGTLGDTRLQPMWGMQWRYGNSYPAITWRSNFNVADGQWHDLEFLGLANTPGVENGVGSIWVDGVRRLHQTNVNHFVAGQTPRIDHFWTDPTYGGRAPGQAIWFEIDQWYCSVK